MFNKLGGSDSKPDRGNDIERMIKNEKKEDRAKKNEDDMMASIEAMKLKDGDKITIFFSLGRPPQPATFIGTEGRKTIVVHNFGLSLQQESYHLAGILGISRGWPDDDKKDSQ